MLRTNHGQRKCPFVEPDMFYHSVCPVFCPDLAVHFHHKEKEDVRKIERVIKFDVSLSTQESRGVRSDDSIQLNN